MQPEKVLPYYVEFMKDEFAQADAIAIAKQSLLELLIDDMEKCEARQANAVDAAEKALVERCRLHLETESPLCDMELSDQERENVRAMSMLSVKPVAVLDTAKERTEVIELCLAKAGIVFFYTAGPKEVHAWAVKKDSDIVSCAGKIHTDLARGFIKGDIAAFDDYMQCHNWTECQKKGLVKVVDRDYTIRPGDIIEIRFAV